MSGRGREPKRVPYRPPMSTVPDPPSQFATDPRSDRPSPPAPPPGAAPPAAPMPPGEAPRRGHPVLAWIVIAVVAGVLVLLHRVGGGEPAAGPATDDPVAAAVTEMQARLLVGLAVASDDPRRDAGVPESTALAARPDADPATVDTMLEQLPAGTVRQRLRKIVVAAELGGPDLGLRRLAALEDEIAEQGRLTGFDPAPEDAALLADLRGWLEARAAADAAGAAPPDPAPDLARRLEEGLGWFGRLALRPPGSADAERRAIVRSMTTAAKVAGSTGIGVGLLGILGLVGLAVLLVLVATGHARGGLDDRRPVHGIYAETFAAWLVLFALLQVVAGVAGAGLPPAGALVVSALAFLASLAAMAWPVVRGVPWRTVRDDCGLHLGRHRGRPLAVLEPLWGVPGYAMALPILGVGVAITLALVLLEQQRAAPAAPFSPAGGPAHPIVAALLGGNVPVIVAVLFLGAVVAPIVEETFFRGVLHRHLRDASRWTGTSVSVLFSGIAGGLVFAVIHPQGLLAVPALTGLALAMSLLREWRGSVLPSMVVHGISNGLVLSMIAAIGLA